MKNLKQNIEKKAAWIIYVERVIFIIFFLHIVFGHIAFENFIICIENDGSISYENSFESAACCSKKTIDVSTFFSSKLSNISKCNSCDDIVLVENCDDQYTHHYKKYEQIVFDLQLIYLNVSDTEIVQNVNYNKTNQINLFRQLELNKSIVLII